MDTSLQRKIGSVTTLLQEKGPISTGFAIFGYVLRDSSLSFLFEWCFSEKILEKLFAFHRLGYWPRIESPRTFNEKILHRKLYTNTDRYARISDKWEVRSYVEDRVGSKILTEIHHVTKDPATIPVDQLPDKFVVKATHGSSMNYFVEDKSKLDTAELIEQCNEWLGETFGELTNEYWYTDITPRIIVEEYLQDEEYGIPLDFKFLVFHGTVKYIEVHFDRFDRTKNRLFDRDWNPVSVKYDYPLGPVIERPDRLDEMIDIAETLGEEFEFMRVDLYQPNGERIVFGELTAAPAAGATGFEPTNFDFELGSYW